MSDKGEYLLLKWGTLKGWNFTSDETRKLAQEYFDLGFSMSAMMQKDTPRQKEIILELIDKLDGPITNDWSGEDYTKKQAKEYIINYGKSK